MSAVAKKTIGRPREVSGRVQVQVNAEINIAAPIARRLVNVELMKKVGQMIMAGEPELAIDGQSVYWKVPILVVPPEGDAKTYPAGVHALVDAVSGVYTMSPSDIERLKSKARPILHELYPDLAQWMQQVREAKP